MILKIIRCDLCGREEDLNEKDDSWKKYKLKAKVFHICGECIEYYSKEELKQEIMKLK